MYKMLTETMEVGLIEGHDHWTFENMCKTVKGEIQLTDVLENMGILSQIQNEQELREVLLWFKGEMLNFALVWIIAADNVWNFPGAESKFEVPLS